MAGEPAVTKQPVAPRTCRHDELGLFCYYGAAKRYSQRYHFRGKRMVVHASASKSKLHLEIGVVDCNKVAKKLCAKPILATGGVLYCFLGVSASRNLH